MKNIKETKLKMSKSGVGRIHSKESIKKMSLIKKEWWAKRKLLCGKA